VKPTKGRPVSSESLNASRTRQRRRRVEEDEIEDRIAEKKGRAPAREAARVLAGRLDPADDEAEHDHEQQDGDEEQHRKGGAETPLKRVAELVRDQVRIKGAVGAAESAAASHSRPSLR
jgi:hypothetical protein